MMRTTITLDDDVGARLLELQRKLGISFKDAVNLTLRKGLEQHSGSSRRPTKFKVKSRAMKLRPGLNYDNIGELLDQIEGLGHR